MPNSGEAKSEHGVASCENSRPKMARNKDKKQWGSRHPTSSSVRATTGSPRAAAAPCHSSASLLPIGLAFSYDDNALIHTDQSSSESL